MTARVSRRPAYLAVTAVVAVAALLLALLARDDGPPVIRLGAAGTEVAMESDAAEMSVGRAYPIEYRFVLADAARFPAGEGQAWRLDPPSDLRAATSELAVALGLAGQPVTSPYDGGWQVGPDDGSGPTIWVSPSGDWGFHDASWMPEVHCVEPHLVDPIEPDDPVSRPLPVEPDEGIGDAGDPATSEGAAGEGVTGSTGDAAAEEPLEIEELQPCEPVEPPAGIPGEAEARRAAESFFARLGLPATPRITDVHRDDWGAWVSATVPLGSQASDLYVSVGLGPDAVVTSASGTLAQAIELDRYPTIDADAAVERLQGQHAWQGSRMEVLVDPAPPAEGAVEDDVVTILPVPESPEGEPEVVTVTLVAAEPLAMLTHDVDGTVWLLPGVRFTDSEGGTWQVMTVDDDYVESEAEPAPEPEPTTEPGTEEPGGGVEPGDEGSGGPTTPVEEPGAEPQPGGPGEAETLAHDVIGRSEADAVAAIEEAGYVARIVQRDGEDFAVTDDHRTDRINLRIGAGVVTHADVG